MIFDDSKEFVDIIQCNNAPSTRTPRGHQFPAAFMHHVSDIKFRWICGDYYKNVLIIYCIRVISTSFYFRCQDWIRTWHHQIILWNILIWMLPDPLVACPIQRLVLVLLHWSCSSWLIEVMQREIIACHWIY